MAAKFQVFALFVCQALFYALVVFLKKWARIKNDIPINNVICGV